MYIQSWMSSRRPVFFKLWSFSQNSIHLRFTENTRSLSAWVHIAVQCNTFVYNTFVYRYYFKWQSINLIHKFFNCVQDPTSTKVQDPTPAKVYRHPNFMFTFFTPNFLYSVFQCIRWESLLQENGVKRFQAPLIEVLCNNTTSYNIINNNTPSPRTVYISLVHLYVWSGPTP
jgi:hypothetical protein